MKPSAIIYLLAFSGFVACQSPEQKTEDIILFKDEKGNRIHTSDLKNETGKVNYEIMGEKKIDPKAAELHLKARELGQAGEYEASMLKLREAMAVQPDWAYPVYDLAYTYLLKGNPEEALILYKQTDTLAHNGFFTTKTAIYALEGEKEGKFPKGTYLYYMQIEWTQDEAKKSEIATTLTQKVPDFAPAWKELANLLNDPAERLKAIEQGLSKNPDVETKGILLLNKALILDQQGKKEEAKKLLGALIFSPDVTTSNVALAKFALKTISENP